MGLRPLLFENAVDLDWADKAQGQLEDPEHILDILLGQKVIESIGRNACKLHVGVPLNHLPSFLDI
jgi:hypothetical protein